MEKNKNPKKKLQLPSHTYFRYSNIAFQLIAVVLICFFSGKKLDSLMHNDTPWITIALSTIGIFGTIYLIIKNLSNE